MSARESIETFGAETRAWLEANCPPEMRQPSRGEGDIVWGGRQQKLTAPQRLWLDRMAARGWTTPDWPSEFGGGGLSPAETKARLPAPPVLVRHLHARACASKIWD